MSVTYFLREMVIEYNVEKLSIREKYKIFWITTSNSRKEKYVDDILIIKYLTIAVDENVKKIGKNISS